FFLEKTKRNIAIWVLLALLPYGYGFLHLHWIERSHPSSKNLSVALVQTGLLPEQKDYQKRYAHVFIPPLEQWERILRCLKEEKKVDLIVLPEASFPYGAYRDLFPFHLVKAFWIDFFGEEAIRDFPPIQAPFGNSHSVNNTFLAQALANHFQADVILGLDDHDLKKDAKYNAAFYFSPQGNSPVRYEKRVLVPATEYVPLKSWKFIARFLREEFGIGDAFEPGTEVKIFQACIPIGVSICIEEIYSGLTRDLRKSGAELFVNLSNDVWFPSSRLPQQHFDHGRVRAVENGVYIVRACNTGITGGVDCFGRPLACLPVSETKAEALYLSLPIRSYHTLYTWWGDQAILGFSVLSIAFGFLGRKKKLP
ncbi:MAG TPA: apolipoprotein N-acyltransferase, partial [Rhabdochlamydiaceae bacterium]|nr:apolipoprotein N-acyltransferase [Rhabdochlamydiaceae bacterium]